MAIASAFRSACSPRQDRSACSFRSSLPLILYGIVSQKAPIEDLFIGGLLPGLLMLGLLAALGVREGLVTARGPRAVPGRRGARARSGKRSGNCCCRSSCSARFSAASTTLVESAAIAALYTLIVQRFIHRDLPTLEGRAARDERLRGARRRRARHPRRRRRAHQLPRRRAGADAAHRLDAGAHPLADRCSCSASTCSCCSSAR